MAGAFHVNLHGMGSLWSKVEQLANLSDNTADRVRKYAFPELGSPGVGVYIDILQPGLRHTWTQAEGFAKFTSGVLSFFADRISEARNLYASSDKRGKAGFDALIDDIGTPDRMIFSGRAGPDAKSKPDDLGCVWPEDPAIRDGPPQASPSHKFEFNPSTGDWASPVAIGRKVWQDLFGGDPVAVFVMPFTGDWNALYKSGVEFERYAKSYKAMGRNLEFLSDQVPVVWEGQASRNAREQMIVLGRKIAYSEHEFTDAAKVFKTAANDAYEAFDYISGKITAGCDLLVPVAGEIRAGKAITKEAATVINLVTDTYKAVTAYSARLDNAYKVAKAIPESVTLPRPQINGYSVSVGGWFKSSKQGPVAN